MTRPRVLDLFCGEGGAGHGYSLAGFEVVGVDNDPARLANYPHDCHEGDALDFLHRFGHEFDFIHASPPCTGYSRGTAALPDRLNRYPRLIEVTRVLLEASGRPWVIENVADARPELRSPFMLCWSHFNDPGSVEDFDGTPLTMRRHRLFESPVEILAWHASLLECQHPKGVQVAGAYGGARRDKIEAREIRRGGYVPGLPVMRQLLGASWMTEKGCFLSIPPAYTQWIGVHLLAELPAAPRG